jgi:hypothetical protein
MNIAIGETKKFQIGKRYFFLECYRNQLVAKQNDHDLRYCLTDENDYVVSQGHDLNKVLINAKGVIMKKIK